MTPAPQSRTLRDAKPQDAAEIALLHVAAWQTAYRGLLPDLFLDSLSVEDATARWEKRLADRTGRVIVSEDSGRVAGFIIYGPSRDAHVDITQVAEVYALYVDPAMWRSGHGRALMEEVMRRVRAQGFGELEVWVLQGNDRAIRFYDALGFRCDGRTMVEHWRGGVDMHQAHYRQRL
jgi:ribosomal protein S18 acetylase RimI-like enzyme